MKVKEIKYYEKYDESEAAAIEFSKKNRKTLRYQVGRLFNKYVVVISKVDREEAVA